MRSLAPGAQLVDLVLMFSCIVGILTRGEQIREDVGARGAGGWERVRSSPAYGLEGGHSPRFQMKKKSLLRPPMLGMGKGGN